MAREWAVVGLFNLSSLTGANGFKLDGENNNDESGWVLSVGSRMLMAMDLPICSLAHPVIRAVTIKAVAMWCLGGRGR